MNLFGFHTEHCRGINESGVGAPPPTGSVSEQPLPSSYEDFTVATQSKSSDPNKR